jgi:hypothetical protein
MLLSLRRTTLEVHPDPELGRKGNADGCAGSEEVAQSAGREAQLIEAGDGRELRAGRWIRTD